MTHWHIDTPYDDDREYFNIADSLADALWILAQEADQEADVRRDEAYGRAESGDYEDYEGAWHTLMSADRLSILADNAGRFWRYGRIPSERPAAYPDTPDGNAAMNLSMLWTAGLEPGSNGEYQDIEPYSIWADDDETCEAYQAWLEGLDATL